MKNESIISARFLMFIEDKIIYKMVEFWYNMNEQRNGGVAFLSTKPKEVKGASCALSSCFGLRSFTFWQTPLSSHLGFIKYSR